MTASAKIDIEAPVAATALRSRHLLGIAELTPEEIALVLDTAVAMKEIGDADCREVGRWLDKPGLRTRTGPSDDGNRRWRRGA